VRLHMPWRAGGHGKPFAPPDAAQICGRSVMSVLGPAVGRIPHRPQNQGGGRQLLIWILP
jgi:hypothetical protein